MLALRERAGHACLGSYMGLWSPEMLAVEELWAGAACDSGRPVIVFNGGCRHAVRRDNTLTMCSAANCVLKNAVQNNRSMAPRHVM